MITGHVLPRGLLATTGLVNGRDGDRRAKANTWALPVLSHAGALAREGLEFQRESFAFGKTLLNPVYFSLYSGFSKCNKL